ncbi:MAG: DUF2125 domain-containing protein [Paracoccus sp. (in: a-proteobacteria)]
MTRLTSATALGLILTVSPALADATPQSVWERLSGYYTNLGMTVETSAIEDNGATLTVRGLKMSQQLPEDDQVVFSMGDMVFSDNGDGSVTVDMADESTLDVTFTAPDESSIHPGEEDSAEAMPADGVDAKTERVAMHMTMRNPGETITVREDGEALIYDYNFPTTEITIDKIAPVEGDGQVLENPAVVTVTDTKGGQTMLSSEEQTKITQNATMAEIKVAFDVQNDEDQSKAIGEVLVEGLEFSGEMDMPGKFDMGKDMGAAVKAGMAASGKMKAANMAVKMDAEGEGEDGAMQKFALDSKTADMTVDFNLNADQVRYAVAAGTVSVEATLPDLPVPVGYGANGISAEIAMPITAKPEAQPFRFAYKLEGVELNDSVWAMFDPTAALPREPASLNVDIDGAAKVEMDLFDPAIAESIEAPFTVESIKINHADLSAIGAVLTVTGDLAAPQGGDLAEQPVGAIHARVAGLQGALDKLVAAGIIPQEQAMAPMMMLGMFAKPVEGETDVMASDIEFKENGQILANGQRVK